MVRTHLLSSWNILSILTQTLLNFSYVLYSMLWTYSGCFFEPNYFEENEEIWASSCRRQNKFIIIWADNKQRTLVSHDGLSNAQRDDLWPALEYCESQQIPVLGVWTFSIRNRRRPFSCHTPFFCLPPACWSASICTFNSSLHQYVTISLSRTTLNIPSSRFWC